VLQGDAGNVSGRNSVASKEGGEPNHAGNPGGVSVWYKWTVPVGGSVSFKTSGSDFNTLLSVYTGNAVNALTPVVSNDDAGGTLQSSVTFNAIASTDYFVAVDGSVGVPGSVTAYTGNLSLNWYPATISNDNFAQAQTLSGNSGSIANTNSGATKENGEPNHAGDRGGRSLWYSWTAPFSGPVLLTTLGSNFDTVLAVYTGTSVDALTPVGSNDDSPYTDNLNGHPLTSSLTLMAAAGTNYKIVVDGSGGRSGNFNMRWGAEANIGGQVAFLGGFCGISNNVTMILSGEDSRAITFNGSGNYTFAHLRAGGNYSVQGVSAAAGNCLPLFLERSQNYFPLVGDVTNADFIDDGLRGGGGTSTISGTISNSQGVGVGSIGGNNITVTLTGSALRTVYAQGNGTFVVSALTPGTYTVTPSSPGAVFNPTHRDYTLTGNQQILNADFGLQDSYTIAGQARDTNSTPLSNVMVTNNNGSQGVSVPTDSNGYYSFAAVAGGSYTLSATKPGFTFSPGSIPFPNLSANQHNVDFIGSSPTAAVANISGQVLTAEGTAVSGATITLTGEHTVVRAISDSNGYFRIENLESGGFYSLIPARPNYLFNPSERSFSLLADKTDTVFTAEANGPNANPLDSAEFFVRQQYLDFLGREPEQGGLDYWSGQLRDCGADVDCLQRRRVEVSAAFFIEQEFQQTELFIYNLYQGGLGRQPEYGEYAHDREAVVAGANLAAAKTAFAEEFVERPTYLQRYPRSLARAEYVDTLLSNLQQTSGVDLSSRRAALLTVSASGGSPDQSRSLVLRSVIEDEVFRQKEYNAAFVLMEYFGYMRRAPDAGGYEFWLAVLNGPQLNNYRGMVCAFITSAEYQQRFSPVITHANYECSQ